MCCSSWRVYPRSLEAFIDLAWFGSWHYLQTLIRCYFSPRHTTGQRYIYTGSHNGIIYVYDLVWFPVDSCMVFLPVRFQKPRPKSASYVRVQMHLYQSCGRLQFNYPMLKLLHAECYKRGSKRDTFAHNLGWFLRNTCIIDDNIILEATWPHEVRMLWFRNTSPM